MASPHRRAVNTTFLTSTLGKVVSADAARGHVLDIDHPTQFQQLLEQAANDDVDYVLVTGSMYAIGLVRHLFGLPIEYDDVQKW